MTNRAALTSLLLALVFPYLSFAQEAYPPSSLQQDFAFVVQTIQDVHPDPYTKISKGELEQLQTEVEAKLTQPLTAADFYELVEPYVASLQDDHTSLISRESAAESGCESDGRRGAFIRGDNAGVLDLPTFDVGDPSEVNPDEIEAGLESFADFFEQAFTTFRERDVRTLIIDLRKNSGGNSLVGDELLGYITDQPYRFYSRVDTKLSKQALEWLKSYGQDVSENDIASATGEIETDELPLETPLPTPLRFDGEVFVLTGGCTASSATDFAAVVKDFRLGTVVGEETGGLPTDFGDSIIFTLPETGLELRVSFKYFVRPGDFDDGRGVLPDCEVAAQDAMQTVLSGQCASVAER